MKIIEAKKSPDSIKMKTKSGNATTGEGLLAEWWNADTDRELASQILSTFAYLKQNQTYRLRQLAVSVRLYSGLSVYSYAGSNVSRMDRTKTLPDDRPTFNLISSCADTLVSKMTLNTPEPKFLTDGADYKKRHLAQELNRFILGEFYQTKAYEKGEKILRDACVMGPGIVKVYRGDDDKVCVDRVMATDLFVDENDSLNGDPQQLIQMKLMDRDRVQAMFPKEKITIRSSANAVPDNSADSGRTIADQIMVVEGWKLPVGEEGKPGYKPGRHTIACGGGVLWDEEWKKPKFPFVVLNYSDPYVGYWGQGLGARLFGTQLSINRIMFTITRAITLTGVPRIFVEQSSKVSKAHINNEIGVIIPYTGQKPIYEVSPSNSADLYQERDRLIEYGYRQEGVSNLSATAQKPAGLDSGEAQRVYNDTNDIRFNKLEKKYNNFYVELAYQIVDVAMDIAKETGKYQTVYPNKDGTQEISLPQMGFLKDTFVIQCFTESSLPRDPAGRIQSITERVQAGMLTIKEGRRLMHFPDLEQNEKLDNASEERLFQILDKIVENGKYTPPDPFLDLTLATELTVKYINLYGAANLEEEKMDLLRTFFTQVQAIGQAAQPVTPAAATPTPTANPQPTPTSPLVPNTNVQGAA